MMNISTIDDESIKLECGFRCLGPMMFHQRAVGGKIHLSQSFCHAKKSRITFKDGLLFSNRRVRVQERIRLRIEDENDIWRGSLRVGFTNVDPDSRSLPLPHFAIPDLTKTPGNWAAGVGKPFSRVGTILEFWMSRTGSLYVANQSGDQRRLLVKEIDVNGHLWAIFDIYGKTSSILLLGSERRTGLFTRKSCQIVPPLPTLDTDYLTSDDLSCINLLVPRDGEEEPTCVVCIAQKSDITLPCGHHCLCFICSFKVYYAFGTCPLCRMSMGKPSLTWVAPTKRH
ncbi:E3 ubiquitin-protein ligase NEURL3 [Syngnathus typhle]|uniref:E3 ubiquitin-protein ligase NEURL3 n=1 Tax=Syngnathus typhle TaxID=161592 RepID=UPI002A6AE9CF|nr:E3 ubiquitin-protein ligase NEURL3 [Syngnathus typhle]